MNPSVSPAAAMPVLRLAMSESTSSWPVYVRGPAILGCVTARRWARIPEEGSL